MASLIVFIHGIGSDNEAWEQFIKVQKKHDLTKRVQPFESNITKIDAGTTYYNLYQYNSKIYNTPFFQNPINWIKESLNGSFDEGKISLENHTASFKSFILSNIKEFNDINLVCHSMGGIITMQMLFDILDENNNSMLISKLNKIILYGSPLHGSNEPKKLQNLLGKNIPTDILNELKPNGTTISSLKQNIENKSDKLKENFEILYIAGDKDSRIIEIEEYTIKKFSDFVKIQGGHSDIIRPEGLSDASFYWFVNFFFQKDTQILDNNNDIDYILNDYIKRVTIKSSKMSTIVFNQVKLPLNRYYEPLMIQEVNQHNEFDHKKITKNIDYDLFGKSYLIIDEAGMGKSTYSKNLVLDILNNSNKIPILFELSEYDNNYSLMENLIMQFNKLDSKLNETIFNKLIVKGKFFIILDGFDELSRDIQTSLILDIKQLNEKKDKSSLLLTSRPQESFPDMIDVTVFELVKLTKVQVSSILLKYDLYSGLNIGNKLINEFNNIPARFLETPLLVGLLYRTYSFNNSIAKKISNFYFELFEALYKGHDLTKSGFVRDKVSGLDIDNFKILLRAFSFLFILKSTDSINNEESFIKLIDEAQKICSLKIINSRDFLDDLLSAVPLLTRDGKQIKFMHRTIAEYFAAEYIINKDNSSEFLNKIIQGSSSKLFLKTIEFIYDISPNIYQEIITQPIAHNFISEFENTNIHSICMTDIFLYTSAISYWKCTDVLDKREDGYSNINLPNLEFQTSQTSFLYGELNNENYLVAIAKSRNRKCLIGNSVWNDLSIDITENRNDINFTRSQDTNIKELNKYLEEGKWYMNDSKIIKDISNIPVIQEIFARSNRVQLRSDGNTIRVLSLKQCNKFIKNIQRMDDANINMDALLK